MFRIIAKRTLREFWQKHTEIEQPLKTWYQIAKKANWENSNDLKHSFASASILREGRVVFNIKGNHYRLVVKVNFDRKWIFIRFIGTHKEYDEIDAQSI